MRFTRRPRSQYAITDRKRAAAVRWQQRQRDSLPLFGPLIAEAQPGIDAVMADRVETWNRTEQDWRNRRANQWRRARRALESHDEEIRSALLAYWNGHRWLPGDPAYLLDLLHGFSTGRLVLERGQVRAALVEIPVEAAVAAFGPAKPIARGWLGSASRPPLASASRRSPGPAAVEQALEAQLAPSVMARNED